MKAKRKFMTVCEAADVLEVPRPTVYRWCRAGILPCWKLGKRVRILASEVERLASGGGRLEGLSPAEAPPTPSPSPYVLKFSAVETPGEKRIREAKRIIAEVLEKGKGRGK